FQLDQRRNLLTGKPLLHLDPAAHDRSDLDIERNATSVVNLRYLQHGPLVSTQERFIQLAGRTPPAPRGCPLEAFSDSVPNRCPPRCWQAVCRPPIYSLQMLLSN